MKVNNEARFISFWILMVSGIFMIMGILGYQSFAPTYYTSTIDEYLWRNICLPSIVVCVSFISYVFTFAKK